MIIATAGHVDHGKTSLIKALTGVDADRLPEEKKRGLTIDLGFVYDTAISGGEVIGFVDVPGHERFIHNMLAGVTAIEAAMLIVAADDGPMPQTREHLEILNLVGVSHGFVALTKIDLVDEDHLLLAMEEVEETLAGTSLEGSEIFPVSSTTGAGVAEIASHLKALAATRQAAPPAGNFRLAVDRATHRPASRPRRPCALSQCRRGRGRGGECQLKRGAHRSRVVLVLVLVLVIVLIVR